MRHKVSLFALIIFISSVFSAVSAQTQTDVGIKANLAGGAVKTLGENKLTLQTKDGEIEVILSDKTSYKRIPPENPVLKAAVESSLSEIEVGDNLLVTGMVSEDKKTIPAKGIYLISKSDIAQKLAKEAAEWKTRGISGQVVSVNQGMKEITVSVRGLMNSRNVTINLKDGVEFRRYAPDSVSYSEAEKSSLEEIKSGDMVRALGDKNEDGSVFSAEKIVTGAFQTIGGTITAIDAEKGEITINNFQTKKDVTIVVGKTSVLKQFPSDMAQMMANFQSGGQGAGGMRPPQQQPAGQGQGQGQTPNRAPGQGQGGGMRGGSIDEMLERFPNITVADLKVGEMIAVSSTKAENQERIKAIKLLSGVEPFIKAQQMMAGRGGQRGGQGGMDGGFTIPGLDGAGFP